MTSQPWPNIGSIVKEPSVALAGVLSDYTVSLHTRGSWVEFLAEGSIPLDTCLSHSNVSLFQSPSLPLTLIKTTGKNILHKD